MHTEPARLTCPKGSEHERFHDGEGKDGKGCFSKKQVPFAETDGGFKEVTVKPKIYCPKGGELVPSTERFPTECLVKETAEPHPFCPQGTKNVELDFVSRCARFRPPIFECPQSFSLLEKRCAKTIASPLVTQRDVNNEWQE